MTTHHTSGAADLPEALDAIADSQYLAGVKAGWNAAQANDPNTALRKIHESRAGYLKPLRDAQRAALAAGQAVAPAEPTREFLERTLRAMEGVIDVADRKTAEFDALRSCVIDLTLMLFKPTTRPAPPAMDGGEDALGWFTVVYRGIRPGDEAKALGDHPKASILSWSNAVHDRDAARAAQKEGSK